MNIIEAVGKIIGIEAAKVPKLIAENGRLEIERGQMGHKQEMPILETPNLLRVGRHLWMVTWKGPEDHSAIQLTQPGT
jgi:hypothetical protein